METCPKVSIALATYNGEQFIAKQIDSLLVQDYPNLEIVISDDCSTDGTWDILRAYVSRDSRIRLLPREKNLGYVQNFIRVFQSCEGELISPCDHDDIWYPQKTSRLVDSLGSADLIYCNSRFIDEDDKPLGGNIRDSLPRMISGSDPRCLIFCTSICGHAMLFRSSLLQFMCELDSAPYIDWAISFLAAYGAGIVYLDEVLVDWRQHLDSKTYRMRQNMYGTRGEVLKTDGKMIAAFAAFDGEWQNFVLEAKNKFERWQNSYIDLSMFLFVLRHGHITHAAHPAKFPSLKYLFGHKLKKMLRPNYY